MDRDVRTLLEEKAEEMRLDPRIPGRVLKRARRRRVVSATVAGAVTLAAAVGFYAGARALLDEAPGPPPDRDVQPAGRPASAPIWPSSEEEIRAIQSQVAEGHIPLWLSPGGVAHMYAVNVLGWDPEDVEVRVPGDDPVTAVIANPTMSEAAGVASDVRTALTLARVPDTEDGVYVVAEAHAESLGLESPTPGDPVAPGGTVVWSGALTGSFPRVVIDIELEWEGELEGGTIGKELSPPAQARIMLPAGATTAPKATARIRTISGRVLAITQFRLSLSADGEQPVTDEVAATRDGLREAAQLRDWETLERLIPDTGFTHSYGGDTDPIAYWQDLEQEGEPVLDILATLLELAPEQFRGTYIWPAPAAESVEDWDQSDLDVLRLTNSDRDIRLFQRYGLYLGWRVGIEPDGTWVFFVAGD
ncbi:MAG: hypothetical protein ACRDH8_01230 [Actinomycetota bacterium]